MKNKRLFLLPATIAAGFNLLAPNLHAAAITWDAGGVNNNWSTINNWSDNLAAAGDDVTFNATGALISGTTNTVDTSISIASLTYSLESATLQHTTAIAAGQTLTVTGNFLLAGSATATTATNVTLTGATGTLTVGNSSNSTFQVGQTTPTAGTNTNLLDMSGLGTFNANLGISGTFRLGAASVTQFGALTTVKLAATSSITANALGVGDRAGRGGTHTLKLGSTATTLNVNTISIGPSGSGGRGNGELSFETVNGILKLRAADTTSAVTTLNLINSSFGTSGNNVATANLTGHDVDAKITTLNMARRTGTGNTASGFLAQATLSFDQGTLDVGTANMGANVNAALIGKLEAIINIGGGTANFGTINMADNTLGDTTKTITANLNLTGGTTTVTGEIIKLGTTNAIATLAISGSSTILDMSGKNITSLTGITYTSGLLKNLGVVNTGMTLAGSGSRVFDQAAGISGQIQGAITGTGLGLTKQGTGSLTLGGSNSYAGQTTISAGTLQFAKQASLYSGTTGDWTAANINVKNGGTLGLNVGGTNEFTAGNITTLLANLAVSSSATNGMNAGSILGFDTTNAAGGTFTIGDVISDTTGASGGARGLSKLGNNTLTLSQANTYTGTTTIDRGSLKLDVTNVLTGGLTFGASSGSTNAGTLDLSAASATFGSLTVRTNSATANSIAIGSGETLTLTGSAGSNVISVGTNVATGTSKLQVTGAGTLTVSDATRNIVVANTASSSNLSSAQLDLSGLGTFNATVANLYVGRPTSTGMPNDILTLAGSNTINATGNIAVGGSSTGGATGLSKIILGTANTLEAALFAVGGARSSGTMEFNTGLTNPTVTLRGAGGIGTRTNIILGDGSNSSTIFNGNGGSNASTGTMNFTGGTVNASINELFVGYGAANTTSRGEGNGSFIMDGTTSNVDINTLVIAQIVNNDAATTSEPIATASTSTFTVINGTLQVNTSMTLANDIDTTATTNGTQNVQATFTVAGGNATIGALLTPVNMILGNHLNAGNPGLATAAVSVTGGTLNVFGDIKEGNLGAGTIASSLALSGGTLDMKGGNITDLDSITYTAGTLKNLGIVNTGMTLAGTGSRVFDQGVTHLLGDIQGTITGTGVGLDKQGLGKLTLSGTNTYDGVTTVTAGTLQFAKEASLYNAAPASWTAANINVKGAATLALNVDSAGTAGFTSGSIDTLLTNISVANTATEGLQAGATLGLDTSTATAGTFTQGNAIADSTGANGGAIGLTKSGAGTLVLDKANSYSGVTTLTAGTLELANATAAGTAAGGIILSGASAAILQINSGITTGDNITFSNTNVGSKVVRDVAVTTAYNTGTSGILKSNFTPVVDLYADTTAEILDGARTLGTTLEMLFADTAPTATNDGIRRSDVFGTNGTATDTYVIQLSTGVLAADSVLGWLNGTNWVHAGTNFFNASYTSAVRVVGDYGYDSGNVWAVVDHGGSFAAVPEPTSALAGLLIGAGLLRRRRATHHNL